jgi:hypothetical protein
MERRVEDVWRAEPCRYFEKLMTVTDEPSMLYGLIRFCFVVGQDTRVLQEGTVTVSQCPRKMSRKI